MGSLPSRVSPATAPTIDIAPIAEKPAMNIARYKLME
jgi:hypothetical protein